LIKILVCGGRDYTDAETLYKVMDEITKDAGPLIIVQGEARGADRLAKQWAIERGHTVRSYPADWDSYDSAAGPIRNRKMLVEENPDIVLAFPGGRGTKNMVTQSVNHWTNVTMDFPFDIEKLHYYIKLKLEAQRRREIANANTY
jgi:hypothetical protein